MAALETMAKRALVAISLAAVLLLGVGLADYAAAQDDVITIEFWHIFSGTLGERIGELVEQFEAEHPNIDVNLTYVPYDAMLQNTLGAVAASNPPAIAQLELTLMARLAADGALQPIEGLLSEAEFADLRSTIIPSIAEANSYNGQLVTVPMGYNSNVLYYNPELIEAAGLDPETDLPTTWDELIEIVPQLTVDENNDGEPEVWGYGFPVRAPWILEVRLWQSGAEIFSDDNSAVVVNSDAAASMIDNYIALISTGGALPVATDTALNELADLFAAGRVAMFEQSSTSFFGITERAPFEVGVSTFPTMGEDVFSMGGYNLGIFDQVSDEEKAAALELALWWSQPENAAQWTAISNYMPGIQGAWETDTLAAWVEEDPRRGVASVQMPFARPRPNQPAYPQIAELIADAFEASVTADADPMTALNEAAERGNAVLEQ